MERRTDGNRFLDERAAPRPSPTEEIVMKASMFDRISQFARSPKGQQMIRQVAGKAQQFASDPKNRARIDEARRRFGSGGGARPR
jgi:hypothetical protein